MNWEKLRSPTKATFENSNFQFPGQLGKLWQQSLRPAFKSVSFNLWMNWENLCPNLSFAIENSMGNLRKTGHILIIFSNFKNLSLNFYDYMFSIL